MILVIAAAILPVLAAGDADLAGATKLPKPGVQYRPNEASATTSPWIDANGWQILRNAGKRFFYDVTGNTAALAAAEAFAYGANAGVHTDDAGMTVFHRMLEFLRGVPDADLPAMANFGVIDDGSDETGELMNLMARNNLLYKVVAAPDPHLNINVRLGTPGYSKSDDPSFMAHKLRAALGDDKRLLRIYGSQVVIARLLGDAGRARVHILNYSNRPVAGLRVRVLGAYPRVTLKAFGNPDARPQDVTVENGATEFTVAEVNVYAVADLAK